MSGPNWAFFEWLLYIAIWIVIGCAALLIGIGLFVFIKWFLLGAVGKAKPVTLSVVDIARKAKEK